MKPHERQIELATGLRYHVREWGDADDADQTVILVHGFLDSSATWCPIADAGLAAGRHLVAPDMRGHGDSDRIGAGGYYYFADYLADLDALLECFPDRRIALVGHSMGGSVCAYFTGTYPQRVEKLALLEGMGPPESSKSAPARIANWIAAWRKIRESTARTYADLAEAAARLRKHDPLLPEELALELAAVGTKKLQDGRLIFKHDRLHATMGPYPFRFEVAAEFWSSIECPVLALEGGESIFRQLGAEAERRYAHIANVRREVVPGAAHMMQRHQPEAIAALLGDFLGA